MGIWRALNQPHYEVLAYAAAIDATLALGDLSEPRAARSVESMPAVERRAFVDAQASRLAGKIAAQRGEDSIDDFATAAQIFRDIRIRFGSPSRSPRRPKQASVTERTRRADLRPARRTAVAPAPRARGRDRLTLSSSARGASGVVITWRF